MDPKTRVHLVTLADGMRQVVPITRTSAEFLTSQNDQKAEGQKMKWTDMTFGEAEAIIKEKGVIDNDYSPIPLVGKLKEALNDKDDEIAELRRQLNEQTLLNKEAPPIVDAKASEAGKTAEGATKAADLIEQIGKAKTVQEIDFIIDGEERVTVLQAAEAAKKKIANS